MGKIKFANPYFAELDLGLSFTVDEYYPRQVDASSGDELLLIEGAMGKPIGCERISQAVKKTDQVLILIDDKSRSTPVKTILPFVLAELADAGVSDEAITIMVALGTHRMMSEKELRERVGEVVFDCFRVINHLWNEPEQLCCLGVTQAGTDIWLNKLAVEADYIIGIGHIVPHRVAGYGGGSKIIQPGISGPVTTGQTHWLSAYYSAEQVLGKPDNPIRQEMEEVAQRIAFRFIVNVVQDSVGKVAGVFAGHPVAAHRKGCSFAEEIYGVCVKGKADIVIAEAYPAESELWLATKALQAADIVVKPGGVIILAAECSEGISCSHGQIIEKYGFMPISDVEELVRKGVLSDLNVASYLARVGNVLERNRTILVSRGISPEQGEKVGFVVCSDLKEAFARALAMVEGEPKIAVLHQGSELLPILS